MTIRFSPYLSRDDFALSSYRVPETPVRSSGRADAVWKALIVLLLVAAFGLAGAGNTLPVLIDLRGLGDWHSIAIFSRLVGVLAAVYFLLSLFFALRYRPVPAPTDDELPACSLVVPAYNEGAMVRVALLSALHNDYPADRLQIIAVDDGSTDDTWDYIQSVARAFPDRVVALKQPKNGGKRAALCAGFAHAQGEFIVTVDSDSKLERDAIRNLVAPMLRDNEIAAVAGKVLVLNRYANLLTRLLAARFFVTFDLVRAAQSRFGAVLCTPGALSAYRTRAVRAVLEQWSTQTFLGSPCTIGEDRALTTWLLLAGHRSAYQGSAIVHTVMPTRLRGIFRMMLRWERGNVREDLVMLPKLATRWRTRDRVWPTLEILLELMQYPAAYVAYALTIGHFVRQPLDFVRLLVTLALGALVQSLYSLRSEKGTDFLYGVGYALFAFIGLQWVFPYSCMTLRDGRWLTR